MYLSSSNGSSSDSRKVSYETGALEKEIDILIRDDKKSPKSLKNIFWLVLLNLATILAVSSANLGNFIT